MPASNFGEDVTSVRHMSPHRIYEGPNADVTEHERDGASHSKSWAKMRKSGRVDRIAQSEYEALARCVFDLSMCVYLYSYTGEISQPVEF